MNVKQCLSKKFVTLVSDESVLKQTKIENRLDGDRAAYGGRVAFCL